MSKFKERAIGIYLYETCDINNFTQEEIFYFTKCCLNGNKILREATPNTEKEIDNIIKQYYENLKTYNLYPDPEAMTLNMRINDLVISLYPEPNTQHTIPSGYDPLKNEITLFITNLTDALKKETEITLRHELQHYFNLRNLSPEEQIKHLSKNYNTNEYYMDQYEYNAFKHAFINVAEYLLTQNINSSVIEKNNKKIPKKLVYELFNFINEGKLPIYQTWFTTLSDIQKKELLNDMLKRFTESLKDGNKLNLRENLLIYNQLKKG